MYKIGIDIGTTTIKCVLFADQLNSVAEASKEYSVFVQNGTWVQQKADDWWNIVVATIQSVLQQSKIDPAQIKGIGVSCQTPTFLALDKAGHPLHDGIIWMDRRADAECQELAQKVSPKRIFEITGNHWDSFYLAPKILWFKKNHPEQTKKIHKLLQCNGYINYKLTGNYSVDRSNASVTLLYDIHKADWSDEILTAIGIDRDILPPIKNGDEVIGFVSASAAHETGLAEGIPVIAGTVDAVAGAMEAGVISGGRAFEATGTSSVFLVALNEISATPYLSTAVGITSQRGVMFGAMSTTGASYKWFRDALMGGENDQNNAYRKMDDLIEVKAPHPTKLIFLPYMAGERSPIWNSDARGVFFGLDLATNDGQMMRAIMEGTSFALRDNIEAAKKAGVNIQRLRSVGGCCKSDIWLKIKASIINMPIEIPQATFGAPAGLALMMAPATGEYASVEEAAESCVQIEKVVYPVDEWIEHYDKMYGIFKSLYQHTKEDFSALSQLPTFL